MSHEKKSWKERLLPQAAITAILGFVAVYDYCFPDNTISAEVDRLRESEVTGELTEFVLDSLYNHLKRTVEPEDDPISKLGILSRKRHETTLDGSDRFDIFDTDD